MLASRAIVVLLVAVVGVSFAAAQGNAAAGVPVRIWAKAEAGSTTQTTWSYAVYTSFMGYVYSFPPNYNPYYYSGWTTTSGGQTLYYYRYSSGTTYAAGSLQISGMFLPSAPNLNDGAVTASITGQNQGDDMSIGLGANALVRMEPGKSYTLSISQTNVSNGTLNLVAPPQYRVVMDGQIRNSCPLAGSVTVSIQPRGEPPPGIAGFASTVAGSRVDWQLGLGTLHSGESAGSLRLVDAAIETSWATLFTPGSLHYESTSDEVFVHRVNNVIRQVIGNEIAVDVVTLSGTSYELRCYNPAQIASFGPPCTFTGNPFVVYRVEQGATATSLKFTKETRNLSSLTSTSDPIVRTEVMTIQRTGSWPTFQWSSSGWTLLGQTPLVATSAQGSGTLQGDGTALSRSEAVSISAPSSTAVLSASRSFALQASGEVLASESLGTTNVLTTTFAYYTDVTKPGNFGYLQSVVTPGGGWEAYDYYDTDQPQGYRGGKIKYKYRPFGNAPSTATRDVAQGEVTYFEYSTDPFGFDTRPALVQTTINGTMSAKVSTSYSDESWPLVTATRMEFVSSGSALSTVRQYFSEASPDTLTRGKTYSIVQPDGVKRSYAYEWGTWNGTTFTPGSAPTSGGPSMATRSAIILGTTNTGVGTELANYGNVQISPVRVVNDKSTLEVAIRDKRALLVRSESHIRKNNGWQLVGYTDYTYNLSGLLTSRVSHTGATYTATYDGLLKTSETDEYGVVTQFTYDVAGRVSTSTKQGVGSIGSLTTTYTYDAMGRVVSERVGPSSGEAIVSGKTYDDAGRTVTESPPGNYGVLTHSFNVSGRTHTTTAADGGTTVVSRNLDGAIASRTGTAIIAEYRTYGVETAGTKAGQRWEQTNLGSAGSPRWNKAWRDWAGREVETNAPGFTGQANVVHLKYYNSSGQLDKTTTTGKSPTLFTYNVFSEVIRTGVDVNNDGSLVPASADRITDTESYLESVNGAWWHRTDTRSFPNAGSGTSILLSVTRKRLTGYSGGRVSENQTIDAEGNVTVETLDIQRSARTSRKTTSKTGLSYSQLEDSSNGLLTGIRNFEGLTSTRGYDSLWRPVTSVDSRGNSTMTGYVQGTRLVQTVTNAVGNSTVTSYDSVGRIASARDAKNFYAYTSYNSRGQVFRQWGGAATPVQYAYDSNYGDRVSMSTYRGGTDWSSATWPGNVGTADTTVWAFDAPSGLLVSKTDALGRAVTQTYNVRGQTATLTLARGVVTTFGYDGATGELLSQTYSDGTPSITYAYTRSGQVDTVSDTTGVRDYLYDSSKPWRFAAEAFSTFYGNRIYSRLYHEGGVIGRVKGFQVKASAGGDNEIEQTLGFSGTGRLETVTSGRLGGAGGDRTFRYTYLTNSGMLQSLSIDGSHPFTITRTYENQRDLLTSIVTKWSTSTRVSYGYTSDERGHRSSLVQSGDVFADYGDATHRIFAYNGRGELEADVAYMNGSATDQSLPLPGRRHEYSYDNIGSRVWSNRTGVSGMRDDYTTNGLNQYVSKENNTLPVSGVAAPDTTPAGGAGGTAVAVKGRTVSAGRQGRFWSDELAVPNTLQPWRGPVTVFGVRRGSGGADSYRMETRMAEIAASLQNFSYDLDGNITSDGLQDYAWDAENRLIRVETSAAAISAGFPNRMVEFKYDFMHRRVQKRVVDRNVSPAVEVSCRRFLYDGWSVVMEFNAPGGTSIGAGLRSYTWGLDIARTLTDAGGVGALLQISDHASGKSYLPAYDGNGNIVALFDGDSGLSGACVATYEYSPYGELLRSEGSYAKENPFRFSTKVSDDETGLVYYGRRYYSPSQGRFFARDPKQEAGGINLYGFVGNNAINRWDVLGLYAAALDGGGFGGPYLGNGGRWAPEPGNVYTGRVMSGWYLGDSSSGPVVMQPFVVRAGETDTSTPSFAAFTVNTPMLFERATFRMPGSNTWLTITQFAGIEGGIPTWNAVPTSAYLAARTQAAVAAANASIASLEIDWSQVAASVGEGVVMGALAAGFTIVTGGAGAAVIGGLAIPGILHGVDMNTNPQNYRLQDVANWSASSTGAVLGGFAVGLTPGARAPQSSFNLDLPRSGVLLADGEARLIITRNGGLLAMEGMDAMLTHRDFAVRNGILNPDGTLADGYWIGTIVRSGDTTLALNSQTFYGNQLPNADATFFIGGGPPGPQ